MRRISLIGRISACLALGIFSSRATGVNANWDNGAANNDFANAVNWATNTLPNTGYSGVGDYIRIDLAGASKAVYSATLDNPGTGATSAQAGIFSRLQIGDVSGNGELEITGGKFWTDSTSPSIIGSSGRTGTLTVNGTSADVGLGGYVILGNGTGGTGVVSVVSGSFASSRDGTIGGISKVSIALGNGSNARGTIVLSGGQLATRTGMLLGVPGTTGAGRFEVRGGGIANIGTISDTDDGFWLQNTNSILAAYVTNGALGTIFVDNLNGATGTYSDGNVIFMPGSKLEVGFLGTTNAGSWDVMHWEGKLLTNGLAFVAGTDTNWSFAFVDTDGTNGADTLRLSYGTPAPTPFVHPGGLHTDSDFARMRTKVAAGAQPWLSRWAMLTNNSHAQLTYTPNPQPIVYRGYDGVHAENYATLFNDIAAAYQCALRYQVSGDPNYANKAVEIMNAWSGTLTNISGTSDKFLAAGIYGYEFASVGEMLSRYGGWSDSDKQAFKVMMLNVFYPMNHDFLVRHNGACLGHYWANWDLCNMSSIAAIGVLCDDQTLFDEAVDYFKNGEGNGAIGKAGYYMHPGHLCQWQESGRDQGHNTLGVGLMGPLCEIAWNQGVDLYSYAGNRFLAGCEYIAKYNLTNPVPYVTYNNCDEVNQTVISTNGQGTLRPCWEMVYNHYVNRLGLAAPYSAQFATLVRPEGGGGDYGPNSGGFDSLGFGTLTYTRDPSGAVPLAAPAIPTGLTATAPTCGQINLQWNAVAGATSYNVMRSLASGGPYTTLVALEVGTTNYTDTTVLGTQTYYYVVSAANAGGESDFSAQASATSSVCPLPWGWLTQDIGSVATVGGASLSNNTFTIKGAGSDAGGTADSLRFVYRGLTNNGQITARWVSLQLGGSLDKIGLMMRETMNANSKMVALLYDEDNSFNCLRLPRRASTGANAVYPGTNGPAGAPLPLWLRLTRTNDVFGGYYSGDGVNWTLLATVTNSGTPSVVYAGMEVCSRNPNWLGTAVFDNVSVTSVWPPLPGTPSPLTGIAGDSVALLSWPASANSTGYNLKRGSSGSGPFTLIVTNAGSLALTNTGLANGALYYYVVSGTNEFGESADSSAVGVRPVSTVPPQLGLAVVANQMQFNWPTSHVGWKLQVQTNTIAKGLGTNWATVAGSLGTNQMIFPVATTNASVFFRLTYP
jgi:hypothetical protein